ncbi:hypothetical protein K488DRAFT_82803 [Vararia minispora EC-137]|uniref:Uncharacterized protein n=1 Tax=Vararia minispora EC-137 TaxID=1314806 RepID=A0ACB8QVF6_9AGAM|nr:hypothetical protein K488DRAFT_82803 [Vararia minispora EC-137]
MAHLTPAQYANALISSYFHDTVVLSAIGHAYFKDRLGRFLTSRIERDYHLSDHADQAIIQFLSGYARRTCFLHRVPQHCVTVPAYMFTGVDVSNSVQGPDSIWYIIIDVAAPYPAHVVPVNMFIPYADSAPARTQNVLSRTEMIPHFFVTTSGQIGVPITGSFSLLAPNRPFGEHRTSLKVKFGWPGYADYEGQIQFNSTSRAGPTSISSRRLAELVAGQKAETGVVACHDPGAGWRIGGHGGIRAHHLSLLCVIFVSPGAVMPILQTSIKPQTLPRLLGVSR